MKPRTTLILAVILLVLAAAATLFETGKRRARRSEGEPVFPAYLIDRADAIRIDSAMQTVELARDGDRWIVLTEGGHRAEPDLVTQILEPVAQFRTSSLISRSPERHGVFEVDDAGTVVRISGRGQELAAFVVGRPGPDFLSCYIRPLDGNKVYQVPTNLANMVNRGDQSWRNMTMLEAAQDDIISYTTRNPRETVTVERSPEGEWIITEPVASRTDPQVMNIVLSSMTRIRAVDFPDTLIDPATAGIEPDTTTLVIRLIDGTSHRVIIGGSDERNRSYSVIDGDPTIYLVPRGRWNTVFRPLDSIRIAEPESDVEPELEAEPAADSARTIHGQPPDAPVVIAKPAGRPILTHHASQAPVHTASFVLLCRGRQAHPVRRV